MLHSIFNTSVSKCENDQPQRSCQLSAPIKAKSAKFRKETVRLYDDLHYQLFQRSYNAPFLWTKAGTQEGNGKADIRPNHDLSSKQNKNNWQCDRIQTELRLGVARSSHAKQSCLYLGWRGGYLFHLLFLLCGMHGLKPFNILWIYWVLQILCWWFLWSQLLIFA